MNTLVGQFLTLFLLFTTFSCQQRDVPSHFGAYIATPQDSSSQDSLFGIAQFDPFQWMSRDQNALHKWLSRQLGFTEKTLAIQEKSSLPLQKGLAAPFQFIALPKEYNNAFFCLVKSGQQQGIFKGEDLSTQSTYQPFFLNEEIGIPGHILTNFEMDESFPSHFSFSYYNPSKAKQFLGINTFGKGTSMLLDSLPIKDKFVQVKHQVLFITPKNYPTETDQSNQEDQVWIYNILQEKLEQIKIKTPFIGKIEIDRKIDSTRILFRLKSDTNRTQFLEFDLSTMQWNEKISFGKGSPKWVFSEDSLYYCIAPDHKGWPQLRVYSLDNQNLNLVDSLTNDSLHFLKSSFFYKDHFYNLYENPGQVILKVIDKSGQFKFEHQFQEALALLDFRVLKRSENILFKLISSKHGPYWINYNNNYTEAFEFTYRSLSSSWNIPVESVYKKIRSYDGAQIALIINYQKSLVKNQKAPSLIVVVDNDFQSFEKLHPNLSLINRFIKQGGYVIWLYPRGIKGFTETWFESASKKQLQLAYDDVQASLVWLNQEKIGDPQKRSVLGYNQSALYVAALGAQRPDLANNILLQNGLYDLTHYRENEKYPELWYDILGSPVDSLNFHYLYRYAPANYLQREAVHPNCLILIDEQFNFVNPVNSLKYIAHLQVNGRGGPKLIWTNKIAPIFQGEKERIAQDRLLWTFTTANYD